MHPIAVQLPGEAHKTLVPHGGRRTEATAEYAEQYKKQTKTNNNKKLTTKLYLSDINL